MTEACKPANCICPMNCPVTEDRHYIDCPAHEYHAQYLEWSGKTMAAALPMDWRVVEDSMGAFHVCAPRPGNPGREDDVLALGDPMARRNASIAAAAPRAIDALRSIRAHAAPQPSQLAAAIVAAAIVATCDGVLDMVSGFGFEGVDARPLPAATIELEHLRAVVAPFARLARQVNTAIGTHMGGGLRSILHTETLPVGGEAIRDRCSIEIGDLLAAMSMDKPTPLDATGLKQIIREWLYADVNKWGDFEKALDAAIGGGDA